jgi:hypothetical protein
MDGDALAAGDEADDRIARDRVAALPEPDQKVPYPLDPDAALARIGWAAGRRRQGKLGVVRDTQLADDLLRADGAVADRGVEVVQVLVLVDPGDLQDSLLADGPEARSGQPPQFALQRLAPVDDVLVALLALEPLPDLLAAWLVRTMFSQSRDGPCSALVVTISTMSPFFSR